MVGYFLALLFPFSLFFFKFRHKQVWKKICFCYIVIFLCCGHMTGSDWRAYEIFYGDVTWNNYEQYLLAFEPLFVFFVLTAKSLGIGFWIFTCLCKILSFVLTYKLIERYTPTKYFYLALMIYVATSSLYLYIDAPFRNMIAISIFLFSIRYIEERKFAKYLLCMLVAIFIHTTALIMLPAYFVAHVKLSNWIYGALYLIALVAFSFTQQIFDLLGRLFASIPFIMSNIQGYGSDEDFAQNAAVFTLGGVIRIIILCLLLYCRQRIMLLKNGIVLFNLAYMYLLIAILGFYIPIFSRFVHYFAPFYAIVFASLIVSFEYKTRYAYIVFLLAFVISTMCQTITSSYKYIPYSNYVWSKFKGEELDYDYRSIYNIKHSPYTKEM